MNSCSLLRLFIIVSTASVHLATGSRSRDLWFLQLLFAPALITGVNETLGFMHTDRVQSLHNHSPGTCSCCVQMAIEMNFCIVHFTVCGFALGGWVKHAGWLILQTQIVCILSIHPCLCRCFTQSPVHNQPQILIHLSGRLYTASAGPRRVIMQALHTVWPCAWSLSCLEYV